MSSGIRTFFDEYKGEPETHKSGHLGITQVGVGKGKTGIAFTMKSGDFVGKVVHANVTLNENQIKVLIGDLIAHLSGEIHQDLAGADDELTEKQAEKINYRRFK